MRIGVLIIGSLYWDGSAARCQWRHDRLGCGGQRKVRAPIRYGRKSSSLLLTATEPTLTNSRYASAREVADAWRADATGHVSYFYNNRQHGISTFEDDEIERLLKGEPPNTGL